MYPHSASLPPIFPLQVFLDQCIHHPFIYFPAFYIMKVQKQKLSTLSVHHASPSTHTFQDAIMSDRPDPFKAVNKYRENMVEDLFALWKVCTLWDV